MSGVDNPTVLSERSGVLAVAKPAGLATQAPPGIPSVEAWLRGRLPAGAYVGIPHRLDRPVSGVLLLATTPRAARKLSRQFERREIAKEYLAIVTVVPGSEGSLPDETERVWTDRLAKIPDEARGRVVADDDPEGREAVCAVRRVGPALPGEPFGLAMLRLEPRTGRMHQLRIQAASRGLPIVGDTLYGGPEFTGGDPAADPRARPIALHARSIRFVDPDAGDAVEVVAPLPESWPEFVRRVPL